MPSQQARALKTQLLHWYDAQGRALPWRVRPEDRDLGRRADPYRVWLSEIMLQQTTVAAVRPYYAAFLERFPTVIDLAAARVEDVLSLWAGLGYYARARNLHKCAQAVAARGGEFPDTEADLLALPGIGAYTAAAIAAVCFDLPTNVVDGNVERVMARMFAEQAPLPAGKPDLRRHAAQFVDTHRPGDYAQALMDLGATVCRPRNPACGDCPWAAACRAQALGAATDYPRKTAKKPKPVRHGVAFVLQRDERVFLLRRPGEGLLGGMAAFPSTPWTEADWPAKDAEHYAPFAANWAALNTAVTHVFTHFRLELSVWRAVAPGDADAVLDGWWASVDALAGEGLPTVMAKVAQAAGLNPKTP